MSNSGLATVTLLSPHHAARTAEIDTITIHHAAYIGATATAIGAVFRGTREASSNYGVGYDGEIGLYVPEDCRAFTSSNRANDDRAVTIEVANAAGWPDWPVSDASFESLIALCVDICHRHGKRRMVWWGERAERIAYVPAPDEMRMTVHRDFAATACCGDWLYKRMGLIAAEVTERLEKIELEETDMTGEQIYRALMEYLHSQPVSDYAEEASRKGIESGIFMDGDNDGLIDDPAAPVKRQDLAVVLDRLGLLNK